MASHLATRIMVGPLTYFNRLLISVNPKSTQKATSICRKRPSKSSRRSRSTMIQTKWRMTASKLWRASIKRKRSLTQMTRLMTIMINLILTIIRTAWASDKVWDVSQSKSAKTLRNKGKAKAEILMFPVQIRLVITQIKPTLIQTQRRVKNQPLIKAVTQIQPRNPWSQRATIRIPTRNTRARAMIRNLVTWYLVPLLLKEGLQYQ